MKPIMNQGRERPKYTASCITKDIMPVARISFCIHAYQDAHSSSMTLSFWFVLYWLSSL